MIKSKKMFTHRKCCPYPCESRPNEANNQDKKNNLNNIKSFYFLRKIFDYMSKKKYRYC